MTPRYGRIVVKLSGAAFAGSGGFGLDPQAVSHIAEEILAVKDLPVQVGIMVGGGNIFRGSLGAQWGIERAEADNIGAMGTVINSLFLRGALAAGGAGEVRVMSAVPMESVAEPYIRLRAIHHLERGYTVIFAAGIGQPYVTTDYAAVQRALEVRADALLLAKNGADGVFTADPNVDPSAKRYATLTYDDALRQKLEVMDQAAFILARDHHLPLRVFGVEQRGAIRRLCLADNIGTHVAADVQTALSL